MPDVHIDLDWWPPSPDEPIGADRARELVDRLKVIADPVVQAAEADLRQRIHLLLIVALVILIYNLITSRRVA